MGKQYDRLLASSKQGNGPLKVVRNEGADGRDRWSVGVSVTDPVSYTAHGYAPSIDEAATQVIDQLDTVGVKVP
jgi:hypothetical protein